MRPRTLLALARRRRVTLPADNEAGLREWFRFRDFDHFVEIYLTCSKCVRDPEDFQRLLADFALDQAAENIRYSDDRQPNDSLFRMTWTPVAGAAGYWVHVFQYRSDATQDERVRAGSPSPVFNGKVRDYLIAYVPGTTNSFKLGATSGAEVLTRRLTIFGQVYQVRVSAVDNDGQLIGFSHGDTSIVAGVTTYQKYAKGSFDVNPTRQVR